MTTPAAVVVDMGGTTTRVGVFSDGALLPGAVSFPTPRAPAGDATGPADPVVQAHLDLVAAEVDAARAAQAGRQPRTVGVAVGATVDGAGLVRNASMLWGRAHTGFDLAGALRHRLPWARVEVSNDIAAAAWRYRHLGRFGLVTVSTGIAVKVFDDRLPLDLKLVQDADGLGGEIGHVPVRPAPEDDVDRRRLGREAAAGSAAARAALLAADVPWCECGNTDDLCSHASGPATVRAVARHAAHRRGEWERSALAAGCGGEPARVTSRDIARAAGAGDSFALDVLAAATRPLALTLLHLSAQLGLRRFVVMGGFARGVGAPWFAALRSNLGALLPDGAWFTGWTGADLDALIVPSPDDADSLIGAGRLLEALHGQVRELRKPVGRDRVEVRRIERPACGREQVLAEVAFAGICGTDLQIVRGERGWEPGVPGHECVARVVDVGANVHAVSPGTVVAVNPNHPHDEHDKLGHNLPGVLQDVAVWDGHLAERGQLIELPAEGSAAWVLLEPLACTVRSLRQAGERWTGRTVLVVGAGVSGLLHVLLARRWGADRVLLANRGPGRLAMAVERGVVPAVDCLPLGPGLEDAVLAATDGAGADAAVLTMSGSSGPASLDLLWRGLADGSTVHLFGGCRPEAVVRAPDGSCAPVHPIRSRGVRHRVRLSAGRYTTLLGSRGADRDDFTAAMATCLPGADGTLDLAPLVSHVVSLDAAPRVIRELGATGRVGGDGALRVVVDLRRPGDVVNRVDGTLPSLRDPA